MLSSGEYGLTSEPDVTSSSEERTREEAAMEAAASLGAVQEKTAGTKAEAAAQVTETAKQARRTGAGRRKRRVSRHLVQGCSCYFERCFKSKKEIRLFNSQA